MFREAKVDCYRLGMADVKVAVGLGGESSADFCGGLLFVYALQPAFREDTRGLFASCGLRLLFWSQGMCSFLRLGLCLLPLFLKGALGGTFLLCRCWGVGHVCVV